MSLKDQYQGKLALVTGAGDGIGEMLAKHFAAAGLRVAVQDIRREAAEKVAREIGQNAFPLVFDVSDRDAAMSAAEELGKQDEKINLLWLNAGVGAGSPVINGRPNVIEWAFAVNVLGIIWSAQAFRPLMDGVDGVRHVGVTASTAALRAPDGPFPLYAATKYGTFAIAEALRGELAEEGVGVTILSPGLLNTAIWDGAKARPDRFGGVRHMDPAIAARWNEAKLPDVMWPHIEKTILAGGGYLVCATDEGETKKAFEARARMLSDAIIDV